VIAKTVLIVDDDAALRDSLVDILRDEGYNPVSTGTCAEALEIARQKEPKAALLDLKLPDGSGTTLLADLKKVLPDCICTLVTAYADLDSAVAALEKGAFQYLQKPVRPIELLNLLEKIFDIINLKVEKYQAEKNLRESENRFRTIFETAEDAIFMKNSNLKYILINPSAKRLFGLSASQMIGRKNEELFKNSAIKRLRQIDIRVLSGEIIREEFTRQSKSGLMTYHTISVPIMNGAGRVAGICGIARDITEKLDLEAQLIQAQKMEAIGTLAGGIAHDFNNILGAIGGYAELAQFDIPESGTTRAHLDEIIKATKRASGLVKQILAFSRQDTIEAKPMHLIPIVKECLQLIRATLPSTIEIHQNIESYPDLVIASSTQIHQLMMNLAANAAHAMAKTGGTLSVKLENIDLDSTMSAEYGQLKPGPYVTLTVQDTGHGMDETIKNRIFDPYFTTKEKGVGTGLGLSLVHGIVNKIGGEIAVESELGKGATFRVYLPRIDTGAVEKTKPLDPIHEGRECILFVDDEEVLVDIGQKMLEKLGYKVIARTSPLEALEAFRAQANKIDLVISDLTMPNMTGDILARELMRLKPDIPIIVCSGFSEQINEQNARSMGIREFVMKPLVMRKLADTIRKVLDED
jgi:two-component system cell cycle sensor histidine kinase/response regulator CckA